MEVYWKQIVLQREIKEVLPVVCPFDSFFQRKEEEEETVDGRPLLETLRYIIPYCI